MTTMRRSNDDAARAVDEAVAHAVARRTRMLSARVAAAESERDSALRERDEAREAAESALTLARNEAREAAEHLVRGAEIVEADGFTLPDGRGRLDALLAWSREVLHLYRDRPRALASRGDEGQP